MEEEKPKNILKKTYIKEIKTPYFYECLDRERITYSFLPRDSDNNEVVRFFNKMEEMGLLVVHLDKYLKRHLTNPPKQINYNQWKKNFQEGIPKKYLVYVYFFILQYDDNYTLEELLGIDKKIEVDTEEILVRKRREQFEIKNSRRV